MINAEEIRAEASATEQRLNSRRWSEDSSTDDVLAELRTPVTTPSKRGRSSGGPFSAEFITPKEERVIKPNGNAQNREGKITATPAGQRQPAKSYLVRCDNNITLKIEALASAVGADPTTTLRVAAIEMWERKVASGLIKN